MEDVVIGSEALDAGVLTRGQLRWNYRTIFPDVHIRKEVTPLLLSHRILAAWLWSRRRAVVAGLSAAAMHGAGWFDESAPVELIWRCGRPPPGIVVRNERIEHDEIIEVAGLPTTTPERTALDLAKHAARDSAVVHLDALARAANLTVNDVLPLIDRYRGSRYLRRSKSALALMDGGAKSPAATAVRLALIDAGFPVPRTQFEVTDGKAHAIVELGYEGPKVGVHFGGDAPELLERLGWAMIRADAKNPLVVVYLVRAAVIERGFPLYRLRIAAAS